MQDAVWEDWVDGNGQPKDGAPIERAPIYAGRNGKTVERWTVRSGDGTQHAGIFKPLTNPDTIGREAWVHRHLLPQLSVRTAAVLAHAQTSDPGKYWLVQEDLGELKHGCDQATIIRGARAAAEWHRLPADLIPPSFQGHTPYIDEVMQSMKERKSDWKRILAEAGWRQERIQGISDACMSAAQDSFGEKVCSHGDYYPLNLAIREGELVVLDWEYAHRNSVYWDLYNLLDITSPRYRRQAISRSSRVEALRAYAAERRQLEDASRCKAASESDGGVRSGHFSSAEVSQSRLLQQGEDAFIEGYMKYALIYSLWILTLIEGDLSKEAFDREGLLAQKIETLRVIRACSDTWTAPLVSVVTPTYNRPVGLSELMESLLRQTEQDFEAIVVNDAGDSISWLPELYPELDIRVLDLERNMKHVHARNIGLDTARGDYVLLCDDDDLLLPGHMERMLKELKDSNADLVYSDVEIVNFKLERGVRLPLDRLLFAYHLDLQGMREFSTFVPSGCLYRKRIHDSVGKFDADVYHYWDWDFFLRVSEQFRVKRVPAASVLYAFSTDGDNMSGILEDMRPYLDKLSEKHGLGELPTKNFFLLLEEEGVKKRRASSERIWDGQPFVSRYAAPSF